MSQLADIYAAVAALQPTAGGTVVPVRWGATLHNTNESADIPLRLLSPIGDTMGKVQQKTGGGVGHVITVEWSIRDIALLRPVGGGLGLSDIADIYVEYMATYADALRQISSQTYYLVDAQVLPQVLQYPADSGMQYHAVSSTLYLMEIVQ